MLRINEISKSSKNAKIAIEIKYEALMGEYHKKETEIQELSNKLAATNELNKCLLKIT